MSKQSNETYAATDDRDPTTRALGRRDQVRPNRDEFAAAKAHADDVLGLDEKVSDGLRRTMARFARSPLTLYMELLNDEQLSLDQRLDAAHRAEPYLHRKMEAKHGTEAGSAAGNNGSAGGGGPRGPTINLTVNRPAVTITKTEGRTAAVKAAKPTTAERHETQQRESARPKSFKKPVKARQ